MQKFKGDGSPYLAINCYDFTFSSTVGYHIPFGVVAEKTGELSSKHILTSVADLTNTGLQEREPDSKIDSCVHWTENYFSKFVSKFF